MGGKVDAARVDQRGAVAAPARKQVYSEGDYLTDGKRLVEVRSVVAGGARQNVQVWLLVQDASADLGEPPDLVRLDLEVADLRWRKVMFEPEEPDGVAA